MSVSAIRAFLMAMLVLAAWLSDRLGLTLRNVGLAAGAILLVNPVALFSAATCCVWAGANWSPVPHPAGRACGDSRDAKARSECGLPVRW